VDPEVEFNYFCCYDDDWHVMHVAPVVGSENLTLKNGVSYSPGPDSSDMDEEAEDLSAEPENFSSHLDLSSPVNLIDHSEQMANPTEIDDNIPPILPEFSTQSLLSNGDEGKPAGSQLTNFSYPMSQALAQENAESQNTVAELLNDFGPSQSLYPRMSREYTEAERTELFAKYGLKHCFIGIIRCSKIDKLAVENFGRRK